MISKTKFGDRVRILTKSFAINDRPPPWNIIRVNGKKGFIKADYLSVNFHTKEEIDKAPWIGMEYSGEIENCKPGSGSIPKNSGMPEGKAFVIFPMTCRGKSFIVFEERTGIVNEFGVFKTLFVLDRDMFPSGPNSASLITSHSETNTDISCYTQKKIQIPIAFVNLQKGKSQTDANQNTIYTNAIEKAWLYDSDLNTLVPKNVPDGYCFEPHISKNKS
ncbi:hypothetical protein EHQ76_15440 [Leptospira barantonii]|uniref:Uncharacterized protein n=1 Tax=Leptospira barantonii TaxID=2023184 RepID=A0A5F2B3Z4_9LEPT|nr:hypothetical protein [Leptospira barantonii]TGL96995.1 hypothetical protein EHQ76_15440 [Leptospira barantonii]